MSMINIGIFCFYYSYDGMRSLTGAPFTTKISLANMGFSEPICATVNFGVNNNLISCPYGSIQKVESFGIHARLSSKNSTSTNDDDEMPDIFGPRNKGIRCMNRYNDTCNRYIDLGLYFKAITDQCIGKD